MYKAVRPGVCYIKYVIDEDIYSTADNPGVCTKNDDLYQTAAIRVNVLNKPFNGSINVSGSFKGSINEDPVQLDSEGKLSVDICDDTGKEVIKPYVWEQKELSSKGITVEGNMVSFTKPGTFHVRAVSGNIMSDWVEIVAVDPSSQEAGKTDSETKPVVTKNTNPLKIAAKTATVKYSKLKKKTQTLAVTKVIKFTKDAKDKKTYTLVSAKKGSKNFKKYFKIDKTTGKVTVKKGLKKGTYKVKVKVNALGNSKYKPSGFKSVTFAIKVK